MENSAFRGEKTTVVLRKQGRDSDRVRVASLIILLSDYLSTHLQDFCRQAPGEDHVSASQMRILRYLQREPNASLKALSHYLGVMNPTSSNIIRRLANQRLVVSEQAPEQRQRIRIRLLSAGEELLRHYESSLLSNMGQWFAALTKVDVKDLTKALRSLVREFAETGGDNSTGAFPVVAEPLVLVMALALAITDYIDAFNYRYCRANSEGSQVSRAQLRILGYLSNRPNSSLTELSTYLGIRNPTTTTTINLLLKQELVEREKTPRLRKRTQLRTTGKGERLLKGFRSALLAELNSAIAVLNPDEIAIALKAGNALFDADDYNQTIKEDKKLFRRMLAVD